MSARDAPLSISMSRPRGGECRVARPPRSLSCARATNAAIDGVVLEQRLQRADQKRQVAARVDAEPVIRQLRAEQRALGDRRDPVPLEPRFAQRIDDGDLGAAWRA